MPVDTFKHSATVEVWFRDAAGNVTSYSKTPNLRTNGGADFFNSQLYGTSAAGAQANFIGLTTDATSPAATDTVLASEETTNGLGRAQGSVSHTASTNQTVISHTFTYTGSTTKAIAKVGLFTAVSSGTMTQETLLNAVGTVNNNGDTITVNWTNNY